jgi:hypothetical protein
MLKPLSYVAAGKKEIVTGSLDKTIVLWRLEVTLQDHAQLLFHALGASSGRLLPVMPWMR